MRVFAALSFLMILALPASAGLEAKDSGFLGQEDRYVTNLGRKVLANCDAVVIGVLAKQSARSGSSFQREFVVTEAIWGECIHPRLSIVYSDDNMFQTSDFRIALAIRTPDRATPIAEVVGGRTPLDNNATLPALRAYIDLERSRDPLIERAMDLKALIEAHLIQGGVAGGFAGVELMFMVRNHPQVFYHDDFMRLLQLADKQGGAILRDTIIAMRHLVLWTLKPLAEVGAMRGRTESQRMEAFVQIEIYFRRFPETFDEEDDLRLSVVAEYLPHDGYLRIQSMQVRIRELVVDRSRRGGPSGVISRANITGISEIQANPAGGNESRDIDESSGVIPEGSYRPIEERAVETSPSAEEEYRKRRAADGQK